MKTEVRPPGPPVCTTLIPGTVLRTSGTVRRCSFSMSCAVTTVTELAIWSVGVKMEVGLMATFWGLTAAGAACVAVAGGFFFGRGAETLIPGSSTGGETGSCADAADENTTTRANTRTDNDDERMTPLQ